MKKITVLMLLFIACKKDEPTPVKQIRFEGSHQVTVTGYSDHIMEPSVSRDGEVLMFNNSNEAANTDLHWATRTNDSTFVYQGEITGANSESLDGVPSMDADGNLYFVSLRDYENTLETIYQSHFDNGVATVVSSVANISKKQPGWVNFDVEVNASGETLYFADGRFDMAGGPYEADLAIANKIDGVFQRSQDSDEMLKHINTDALEYAACISADDLELYFTRLTDAFTPSATIAIMVSTRRSKDEPFGAPSTITSVTGFVEAPTMSHDGDKLYYHKRVGEKFMLFFTRRVE